MRRRRARGALVVACLLLPLVVWWLLASWERATLPFSYNVAQGSVRFETQIQGKPRLLEFNSLLTKTVLSRRLSQQLVQAEKGIDRVSPSAEFAIGSVRTHLFYTEAPETELRPNSDGVLGLDMFAPSPGFEGQNRRLGMRLTLDFKANRFKLEDGPQLEPLRPPTGTLQTALHREGDGPYYVLLPLNNGAVCRFVLAIGSRDVLLPTGAVLFAAPRGRGYVDALGIVPITLTFDGHDLSTMAIAPPDQQPTGVLGMSLLADYRVILDFRNSRLYLEPANSRSDF
jgi:hypothetical protein